MAHAKKCWVGAYVEIMKVIPPLNISYIIFLPKKLTYFHIVRWSKDICSSRNLKFQLLQAFLSCKKRLKKVWWFMYKNYFLKSTWRTTIYIYIYKQSRGEENNKRRAHASTLFKIYIRVYTAFIVFMINLANLKINYQHLSLSLNWTC